MDYESQPYHVTAALVEWLLVIGAAALIALFVGGVVALFLAGRRAPALVFAALKRGFSDLTSLSVRRIGALARLTIQESLSRRTLLVLFVFVSLFAAGNLFLQSPGQDMPAKPFVSFVMTSIRWVLIPVALLLSCWGLPADIKSRSLHTVVTKPVHRSEIVIGRMLGYSLLTSFILFVVALLGLIWIQRVVPERSKPQLTARVPVYCDLEDFFFLDRNGQTGKGLNVGDMWEHRGFIEGQTKSRAVWIFEGVDESYLNDEGELRMEYSFEAFRSHKGRIDEGVRFRLHLVNEEKGLDVPYPQRGAGLEVQEFSGERAARKDQEKPIIDIPRELSRTVGLDEDGSKVDLFDDLVEDGKLRIELSCEDDGQYIGAANTDLFIRLADKPFAVGYFKAIFGLWLMVVLVCIIGTTASCFLKGPVATLLTFGLVILGHPMRSYMENQLQQLDEKGRVLGGGMLEACYRLVTQMNVQSPLPENDATRVIQYLDTHIFNGLKIAEFIIPNFKHFDMTVFVANGFDVPWMDAGAAIVPAILTVLGYLIPCVILGYFSLQLRELEAK
ncbi:MAG: ABC transporter permease [Planctomycetota bacterium]|nr:MAG: ABC transporter permease [Planctomycetota bacterium]REJ94720.1 MAG: ABC transporter permease [Planctomycetota bacterium]REK31318.1 MAG: ABC transporter permease [Planctomycetota bacterium]REK39043.1 MAG: ABC transporter permease [Planctomycetota bacterium]